MTSLFKKLHININLRIQTFPPIKNLLYFLVLCGGKNKFGKNSSFSKSTRVSKSFRFIDFKRLIWDMPAKVLRIEYDPNRTAFVALICYYNGILSYIFATEDMVPGQKIYTTLNKQLLRNKGCATLLSNCVEGSFFSCLELRSGFGGVLARSAGTQAVYLKNLTYLDSVIRLPSKEEIVLKTTSLVVLGRSSNIDRKFRFFYNAGQKRRLGFRPRSRGVARNPVDHPHGGGGGRCQVTAWAKVAKNQTTRSKKKSNINILTSRKFYINKKKKRRK